MKYIAITFLFIMGCGPGEITTGQYGITGATGPQGIPGLSCTVSQLDNGSMIQCPDGTNAFVYGHKHRHCRN